jgi:hypothetical protein
MCLGVKFIQFIIQKQMIQMLNILQPSPCGFDDTCKNEIDPKCMRIAGVEANLDSHEIQIYKMGFITRSIARVISP